MTKVPRSFITNLWVMIHTLVSYLHGQCLNPWDADVFDQMHTSAPTDLETLRNFAHTLQDFYQLLSRLRNQIYRAYYIIYYCKLFPIFSSLSQPQLHQKEPC